MWARPVPKIMKLAKNSQVSFDMGYGKCCAVQGKRRTESCLMDMWPSSGSHTHLQSMPAVKAKCGPKKTSLGQVWVIHSLISGEVLAIDFTPLIIYLGEQTCHNCTKRVDGSMHKIVFFYFAKFCDAC